MAAMLAQAAKNAPAEAIGVYRDFDAGILATQIIEKLMTRLEKIGSLVAKPAEDVLVHFRSVHAELKNLRL
jgi:hypothetical protein